MDKQNIEKFFKENLSMYHHLEMIRSNLWTEDGRSRVSVMVGAGFSLNASIIEEKFKKIALWKDLQQLMTSKLSHHLDIEYRDILEIAQLFEEEYGRANLDELLKEAIPDDNYEPDELHVEFLNLPWSDIFTTNYDTLLERTKKKVFERRYQVIYDSKDIPNSTSPRIIKLHGSFPSNRPFIFTKNDYDSYPVNFSPFVNMVQQSIMETTFVLLGFSGDDPNFNKWTTWVKKNLGEQMPKIYMIGYGEKHRLRELKAKGITLIDFKDLYSKNENPYNQMLVDLFEFLKYEEREDKAKWLNQGFNEYRINTEELIINKKSYPDWLVVPSKIRKKNSYSLKSACDKEILNLASLDNEINLRSLNEILWYYKKFFIPLDSRVQKHLINLVEEVDSLIDINFFDVLLFLLNQSRFDCEVSTFKTFKNKIDQLSLNKYQKNEVQHEEILLNLTFNNLSEVLRLMNLWEIDDNEIEWGIKKSIIYLSINQREKSKKLLEGYLQKIRNLLSIKNDDYKLLSLESVVIHHLRRLKSETNYRYQRLKSLELTNCDLQKEFDQGIFTIQSYEYDLGSKEKPSFDLGKGKISFKLGDYFNESLISSYAALNIQEIFNLSTTDFDQYKVGIKNLEVIFPLYSIIKRIHYSKLKDIDDLFSREYVYQLDKNTIKMIFEILINSLDSEEDPIIAEHIAIEILSRIYFCLSYENKKIIDKKAIRYLNNQYKFDDYYFIEVYENLLRRIVLDKNIEKTKEFCEEIFNSNASIINYQNDDLKFFEPILVIFSEAKKIKNIEVTNYILNELISILENSEGDILKEKALIRLTFLFESNSLTDLYKNKFIEILKVMPRNKKQGLSDYIFNFVFDKIISGKNFISNNAKKLFLAKKIPVFFNKDDGSISTNSSIKNYFNEMQSIFQDCTIPTPIERKEYKYYKSWIRNFFAWWDSQEDGLLRSNDSGSFAMIPDYLKMIIGPLKNNIFLSAPLEIFTKKDLLKIEGIFNKINKDRPDLSIYLVPSIQRLGIKTEYDLNLIFKYLKSKNPLKIEQALQCLYDYLILVDNKKIPLDSRKIKKELLNIMHYSYGEIFKSVLKTLQYSFKNTKNIYVLEDYQILKEFLDEYLSEIKNDNIIISSLEDFEIVSTMAALVTYLSKSENFMHTDSFDEWKEYIFNHRLPEVRKYEDLLTSH